ncbi:MAG: SCP2 sterol-binding domain-containing protein [Gammaproteobacteria bacterium]|nr:SCP2 sterol-binding domain-containing protein [Gammaproteobacteria bacterium]
MTLIINTVIEELGNRLLRLDPETLARLGELHGKVIGIELVGAAKTLYILPSEAGLRLLAAHDAAPDVMLRGEPAVFARLAFGGATTRAGELQISGDLELGQRFQQVLRALDIDWEEQVAGLVGDVLAHQLGRVARGARAWQAQAVRTLGMDVREYLQEESRILPTRGEVEAFLDAIDGLRASADRLEQRVARLRTRAEAAK